CHGLRMGAGTTGRRIREWRFPRDRGGTWVLAGRPPAHLAGRQASGRMTGGRRRIAPIGPSFGPHRPTQPGRQSRGILMRRFIRILTYIAAFIVVFAAVLFLLNTNAFAPAPTEKPLVIAHRGLGQTYHREGITGETCTAERIYPPEHE